MQMLQQGAVPSETLETMCGQLPLDMQVQLTHFTQAENAAAAVHTALDKQPKPPSGTPSTNPHTTVFSRNRGRPVLEEFTNAGVAQDAGLNGS